ncbi:hypothetical protein PHMEG_00041369, partial [Phytophthora megakarya]
MGWTLPAVFSFDEGVLPATSKRNMTRMFMADKPHRYGSKLFMVCDAKTAYCHRFEVYVGKRESTNGAATAVDYKAGAAAVVRNLKVVLGQSRQRWHCVVIDRYYSSVLLAVELLSLRAWAQQGSQSYKEGAPSERTSWYILLLGSVTIPTMISCIWWDRKPVHYLCTGSVMAASTIERKLKRVGAVRVPCPSAVNDYQNWMSGVDVHDQLRLQSYLLQMSTRFTKYYKSLFLGFLDMVMVNAYLTHKEGANIKGTFAMKRS